MPEALLATKLHIPRLRRDLVHRTRLMERLDAGLSRQSGRFARKLTLVSAPAGYGKTTVVCDWIHTRAGWGAPVPAAWLSLDEADNDPARFLTYVIAALQRIDENIGLDVQAALAESQSLPGTSLLTRLVNDIAAATGGPSAGPGSGDPSTGRRGELVEPSGRSRGGRVFVLVLDDYHLITAQPVHDVLNFLLEHLPETIHLLVAGRSDPPLPISRLRVQGEITEIRTPELRFTQAEAAAFLNELMGLGLSSRDVTALEARTEGWIASLQLAALSLQGRPDKQEFVTAFSGSHRYVIDYLVDEVLSRQPEELQAFLCQTSILDRFCAPLCDAVLGEGGRMKDPVPSSTIQRPPAPARVSSHSQAILEQLERTNLFLVPLDDERRWYRYHHLFADFLRRRLRQSEPEQIPELHRRASQWYEDEGLVDEAIQHALTAKDAQRATRLVDRIAASLVVLREPNKLLKLVDQLPPDMCRDYPMLCLWYAWALLFSGQLEKVEPALQVAEAHQGKVPQLPMSAYATTIRAYLANQMGDLQKAVDLTQRAMEQLSEAPPDQTTLIFQGAAVIWLGVNYRYLGHLDRAKQLFAEAAGLNQKAGNYYGALASLEQSADLAMLHGQLHRAEELYRQGLELAQSWSKQEARRGRTPLAASGLHLGLGTVLYQWNDLAAAGPHIRRAVELDELGEAWGRLFTYRMLAYLQHAEGDYQAAYVRLAQACAIRDQISVRQLNVAAEPSLEQLRILLSRTRPEMSHLLHEAIRWLEKLELQTQAAALDFTTAPDYAREGSYADLARILLATGRPGEALPLIDRLLAAARSMGRQGDAIRYLVLQSLAFRATGGTASALASLRQALNLAEPEGYVRIFVDEGQPMAEMLREAASYGIAPDYVASLLAAFGGPAKDQGRRAKADRSTFVDPPSSSPVLRILPSPPRDQAEGLVEPLSKRELEVLRLMAAGLKHRQVAEELVISLNTVRHHTRNIYGKLDVHRRAQAVAKAKDLGLL